MESGTHHMESLASSLELGADIQMLMPKDQSNINFRDSELMHFDMIIRQTLPSFSMILLSTEAIIMSLAHANTSKEAHIHGAIELIHDKFQGVMDQLPHFFGHMRALCRSGILHSSQLQ